MSDVFLIADSGPLIALAGVEHLALLPKLYSRVAAPLAVIDEILAGRRGSSGHNFLDRALWLEKLEVSASSVLHFAVLGQGETEAIALATQFSNVRLLLDDHKARRVAESLSLDMIGSAGFLVQAKRRGFVQQVLPILYEMRASGYYIGDRVIWRAALAAQEAI